MSGQYIINPLEPKAWSDDENVDEDAPEAFRKATRLSQHISFLKDFFRSYKDFSDAHIDAIEILVSKLYASKGIDDHTDYSKLKPTDYPVMSDLYDLAEQEYLKYENGSKSLFTEELLREICLGLNSMCKGAESKFFNEVLPVALSVFPADEDTEILINPSGCFNIGGPEGDTGLTGRKIMVDTYGGLVAHGGGAFSGKDATKVDRSGAYMARYIAKNIVKAGLAESCQVGISYAIGKAEPIAVSVDSFGTSNLSDEELTEIVTKVFDLRPAAIIDQFDLTKPIFKKTSAYGHFNSPNFPWEKTDAVSKLVKVAKE